VRVKVLNLTETCTLAAQLWLRTINTSVWLMIRVSFVFVCRRADLEALGSALQQYRNGHSALIKWIEETTERQENTQPGQTDSKALSEQLAQQTVSHRICGESWIHSNGKPGTLNGLFFLSGVSS